MNPLMTAVLHHLPVRADQTQRFETSAPHQEHETGESISTAVSGHGSAGLNMVSGQKSLAYASVTALLGMEATRTKSTSTSRGL
jgi:hypothetical protein